MKNFKLIALMLGLIALIPVNAMAAADDFDSVTVEAVELDNDSSDAMTNEVEVPDEQELEDQSADTQSASDSQEEEQEHEEEQENEVEDMVEDSNDDSNEVGGSTP